MFTKWALSAISIAGTCAVMAGCAGSTSSDPARDAAADPAPSASALPASESGETADFFAVAMASDGGRNIAVLSGSVAGGRGGGEVSLAGQGSQPQHVAFTPAGGEAVVDLPDGGQLRLLPDGAGGVSGVGEIRDAEGVNVAVSVIGSWTDRSDEAVPGSGKCGYLDEKMLLIGDPGGPAVRAMKKTLEPITLDLSLPELAVQWPQFDAVVVDAGDDGALNSRTVRTFMQGSKWVVVTNPDQAAGKSLKALAPVVAPNQFKNSWAVAMRVGDPGGSWNQAYETVPLYRSATKPNKAPSEKELQAFVDQLNARGDNCQAVPNDQAERNQTQADELRTDPASYQGQAKVQFSSMVSSGDGGEPRISNVAIPAASGVYQATSGSPLDLPANIYGYSSSTHLKEKHTLPGSQNVAAQPGCYPERYFSGATPPQGFGFGGNTQYLVECPKEASARQVAELSGSDKVFVFLSAQAPAQLDHAATEGRESISHVNVDLKWVVMHQQYTTVNASTNGDQYGTHALAHPGEANGMAQEKGEVTKLNVFTKPYPFSETSWLLARAQTNVALGTPAHGTEAFATKNESSFPLSAIENSNQSKSVSGSWSVNAGGGTFAAVPVFNLGASYSQSWSQDTSLTVPSWRVDPSYDTDGVKIAWDTNTTREGEKATFRQYDTDKVNTFDFNPLNVSGLQANSTYAWQSPCMYGSMNMTVNRKMYFASVYSEMSRDQEQSYWKGRGRAGVKFSDEVIKRSKTVTWDLKPIKYTIDFDNSSIALYPKTIAGFASITPNNEPVIYKPKHCSNYPIPAGLKKEMDAHAAAKAAATAEAKRQEAEAKKAQADKEAAKKKADADRKKQNERFDKEDACYAKPDAAQRQKCLRDLDEEA